MKKKLFEIQLYFNLKFAAVIVLLFSSTPLLADGSKDLYPSNITGVRAYLRSSTTSTVNWPFPNMGVHYVYAKPGERITLASSVQGLSGSPKIILYNPSGVSVVNNTSNGYINNRTAELAGPQLFGQTGGNRYTPIYYEVPVNGGGIYKVEFYARGTGDPGTTVNANGNWTQNSDAGIAAWDVSVINTTNTGFIKGRVYANVLNLSNGTTNPESNQFRGLVYVLTKDGYTYRVNNNGNNGMYFTFFVNNSGFIDTSGNAIYKSLNFSGTSNLNGKVQNPNDADTAKQVTHKMFYTLPSTDLPTSSAGAVPGGITWLKNPVATPDITNVQILGAEGTTGQISSKGGYITFTASTFENYAITIKSQQNPATFVTRILTGSSSGGYNQVYWDGKDGAGNSLPAGTIPVQITVQLQGAEVHFPFFDMEYNKTGTIIELLDHHNLNNVVSDLVYWDDSDVSNGTNGNNSPGGRYSNPKNNSHLPPVNSSGISSNVNGHIWGLGGSGTTGLFGDEKSIDTWTFIVGESSTTNSDVTVKISDLMVSNISADKTNIISGDNLVITVKVKNDGPDDAPGAPFSFILPDGFSPQNVVFSSAGCGAESTAITYNAATKTYSSALNLPNGCEITYTFTLLVGNTGTEGNQIFTATILRLNDYTDPDATNPDPNIPPTDPFYECANNGLSTPCNNIKTAQVYYTAQCYNPANTSGNGSDTKVGITLLKRAGSTNSDNWPMSRKSGHIALESNTQGFVITRMSKIEIEGQISPAIAPKITNPQEGMMVYDKDDKCLKIYSDGAWKCFSKPACP